MIPQDMRTRVRREITLFAPGDVPRRIAIYEQKRKWDATGSKSIFWSWLFWMVPIYGFFQIQSVWERFPNGSAILAMLGSMSTFACVFYVGVDLYCHLEDLIYRSIMREELGKIPEFKRQQELYRKTEEAR